MISRIRECAKEKELPVEELNNIISRFNSIRDCHNDNILPFLCYDDPFISELIDNDFEGINGLEYNPQVIMFVEKLWPKFVEEYNHVESTH